MRLPPFLALTFLGFLALGLPIAVLSRDVRRLGFGTLVVVVVIGLQSLVTIISRHRAGTKCDFKGAKRAVLIGLATAIAGALLYLASELIPGEATVILAVLLAARVLMGLSESMLLTGSLTWALIGLGTGNTWRVMVLQGGAMHLGLAVGALAGVWINGWFGFAGVSITALIVPLIALLLAVRLQEVPPPGDPIHISAPQVFARIWRPGMVLALATVPLAGIVGFLSLTFDERGWQMLELSLAAIAMGYIGVQVLCSRWPAVWSLARITNVSLAVEACGQALLLIAPSPTVAIVGAALTGMGYSLIFAVMGLVALRRFKEAEFGRAVGGYSAFLDLAIGLAVPATSVLIVGLNYYPMFAVGFVAALAALALSLSCTDEWARSASRDTSPRPT